VVEEVWVDAARRAISNPSSYGAFTEVPSSRISVSAVRYASFLCDDDEVEEDASGSESM